MRGILTAIPFALITVICWGFYGPVLHHGIAGMDNNAWAQLLCVGLSYFIITVIVPLYILKTKGEQGAFTTRGVRWGLGAGACGALGALGIITALKNGGSPVYVMPIVFGCAPVVNTFVSIWMGKLFDKMTPGFYLGIILVALGAVGVFAFKPQADAAPSADMVAPHSVITQVSFSNADGDGSNSTQTPSTAPANIFLIVGGICLTVLCWGAYGSLLHKSQHHMENSRLRPLLCVGIAYFAIAVIIPILIMSVSESGFPKATTLGGWSYSMLAGVFGAVGAFGIILSFTFGGKPVFVMPLVFGGAPIINTIISVMEMKAVGEVQGMFYGSLTMVIIGAIVTLVNAPKPGKPTAPADEPEDSNDLEQVEAIE
jgi:drug/metabolite transporter (DMT)-like permease